MKSKIIGEAKNSFGRSQKIRERLAQARKDIAVGRVVEMDETFFEKLKQRAVGEQHFPFARPQDGRRWPKAG